MRSASGRRCYIENEYLRLMVLPEIGGRIHVGLDKTNGYDFFYRQNVIKPALVGCRDRGSPAAWSSTGRSITGRRLYAGEDTDRRPSGWSRHDLVQRSRSDEPHERNARRLPASGPGLCRGQGPALQPDAVSRRHSYGGQMPVPTSTRSISRFSRPTCITLPIMRGAR